MTKKYRESVSRRRAVQAMGTLIGTAAFGCGDDGGGSEGSRGNGTTGGTSTGVEDPTTGTASTGDETTGAPVDECGGGAALTPKELLAGIDHVIVLMMENRFFDHYFGARKLVEGEAINGLMGDESNLNVDLMPVTVFEGWQTTSRCASAGTPR